MLFSSIDLVPSNDCTVLFLLCMFVPVCVCVCFAGQHRLWQSPRQRHRWLRDARNSNKPKNPQKPSKCRSGREGGRGRGFIFPANSFIWLRTEELGQMAPMPLSTKKIAFFGGGLEFRAFNLSATCSTIRTKCLPPYLSHARVSSYSVSARDIYETYLKRRGSRRSDRLLFSCLFTY